MKEQVMENITSAETRTDQHWYIAYTLPRHEKAIAQRLSGGRLSCYLPLYSEARSWKQRRVQLELPLFPCYVFVRMHLEAKTSLLSVPGVVRLLAASGAAVIFPDEEMEALQASLKRWSARPYPFHCSGRRIRLKSGPFAGLEGSILRRNGKRELIVSLDLIQSSMLLEIDTADAQLSI
jgi:transcription antitermination factor NusG